MNARVVIIDNYDSFTYNLYQVLGVLSGAEPLVFRNDAIDLAGLRAAKPTHIVISPGPGSPEHRRDFGVSADVITTLAPEGLPILGVCLGHQGIIHHLGGRIVRAPQIVHGKTSVVRAHGGWLLAELPTSFEVMRYHSLIGDRAAMPAELKVTADTEDDGLIMAVEHVRWPLFGIQFHPESIGTPLGPVILERFLTVERRS